MKYDKKKINELLEDYYNEIPLKDLSDKYGVKNITGSLQYIKKYFPENIDWDKYNKRATRHSQLKLSESKIKEIYILRVNGEECVQIAKKYFVHESTISDICRGHTHSHLFEKYHKITSLIQNLGSGSYFKNAIKKGNLVIFSKDDPDRKGMKLERKDVELIISLYLKGLSFEEIEVRDEVKVLKLHIKRIISGERWKRVWKLYKDEIEAENSRRKLLKLENKSNVHPQARRKLKGEIINYPITLCPNCGNPYPCNCL